MANPAHAAPKARQGPCAASHPCLHTPSVAPGKRGNRAEQAARRAAAGSMGWEGVQPPSEPAGYDPNNKFGERGAVAPAQGRRGSPRALCSSPVRPLGGPVGSGEDALAWGPRVGGRRRVGAPAAAGGGGRRRCLIPAGFSSVLRSRPGDVLQAPRGQGGRGVCEGGRGQGAPRFLLSRCRLLAWPPPVLPGMCSRLTRRPACRRPRPLPHAAQLIRKQLKKCYKESGVNYQQNCRELAQVRALIPRAAALARCRLAVAQPAACCRPARPNTQRGHRARPTRLPGHRLTTSFNPPPLAGARAGVPQRDQGCGDLPRECGAARRAAVGVLWRSQEVRQAA